MINIWKHQLLKSASELFDQGKSASKAQPETNAQINELYRQADQLKVERIFLAKYLARLGLIPESPWQMPNIMLWMWFVMGASRLSLYYQTIGPSDEKMTLLNRIDQQYLRLSKQALIITWRTWSLVSKKAPRYT